MKNLIKRPVCIFLCVLVALSSFTCGAVGAYTSIYPEGVTSQEAENAVSSTDILLKNILPVFTGKTLGDIVKPLIYNSETLSSVTVSVYKEISADASQLTSLGIDVSVEGVAAALSGYPQVSEALINAGSWENVNLSGVDWGVNEKVGFADALSRVFSPFNDLLYMLLCSGTYTFSGFIRINGGDGYTNTIVPMLNALKCKSIMSQADFSAQAQMDKNSMVRNIVLCVFDFLESALVAPADALTDSLPSFSYFVESGEMETAINALTEPIKNNPLVEIATFLKLFDTSMLELDIGSMLSEGIGAMAGESGLELAELDTVRLSQCGSHNGFEFVSDKGRAYVEIMRWLIDTLKLNESSLATLTPEAEESFISPDMLKNLLSSPTDNIVATLIHLFTPSEVGEAGEFSYPSVTAAVVQYTPNLTKENYEKVLNEIDDLLDEFVKEGGSYSSIEALLSSSIYTNKNITALVKGIYGALEKDGMAEMLALLGIDITTSGVAEKLFESSYSATAAALRKASGWSDVSDNMSWGFSNGSRKGFQNALSAALRPLYPLLKVVLAGEDMVIMESITVKGGDGYNTAVIPILEALGCKESNIKTYAQYLEGVNSDALLNNITDPVFDLLDEVFDNPVKTLTAILPNIIYFLNNGSLEVCLSNLLLPVTALTAKFEDLVEIDFDTASLTKELDINKLLSGMLKGSGMKIAEFDINTLSGMGTKSEKTSKRTVNGQPVKYSYIEADRTGVLMSLLRVLAKTIKLPGNENLLMGTMGDNPSFSAYTDSISTQFAEMSEDELIEWLYNLLFKERAQIEIVVDEEYNPTIIYKEEKKAYTALYVAGGALAVTAIICGVVYLNKKRLYY